MHYIQSKILDSLLYAETLRYSQLRPEGIESNHFAYHLAELQKEKLVKRVPGGYTLAPKGLAYVDRLSHKHMKPRQQPKIVTNIRLKNSSGETLLFQRKYQPYIGRLGWPSGKLHLGESLQAAAERELQEKTGLSGIKLTHKGLVYVEVKSEGHVISQVMAHFFDGKAPAKSQTITSERGSSHWATLKDYAAKELMPGMLQLEEMLERKGFFYDELILED